MASPGVLPTYQRYVNGVPIPTGRKSLRMREKYIIMLVFLTFGTVCFGAFFFLPDLRDRVSMTDLRKQFQNAGGDLFLHEGEGNHRNNHGDVIDVHKIDDKKKLGGKIAEDIAREKALAELGLSKDDVLKVKEDVKDDKDKIVKEKNEKEMEIKAEEAKKALENVHIEHGGGENTQGGEPKDPAVKEKRDKVKEVIVTLYQTVRFLTNARKKSVWKHYGKRRRCW